VRIRHLALTALTALAVAAGLAAPASSGATWTSASSSTAEVRASADWTPPAVALASVPSAVRGSVVLRASATDAETGITRVDVQARPVGGSWTTFCTGTASPLDCTWDTTAGSDGPYEVRGVALDRSGYDATTGPVPTRVVNGAGVVLAPVGSPARGTVGLTATVSGDQGAVFPVIEYRAAGTQPWTPVCSAATCSWDTAPTASGPYEVRARLALDDATFATSAVRSVLVDNTAPSVTLDDPAATLGGTVTFSATAADAHSGVAQVTIQARGPGQAGFQDLCVLSATPYRCTVDVTAWQPGTYTLRAVATDGVGNTSASAPLERAVSGTSLRPLDIAAVNGGTAGIMDPRDHLVYEFSGPVSFPSVLSGWTGESREVVVRIGPGATNDDNTIEVLSTNLGVVHLNRNHLPGNGKTLEFRAQMTSVTLAGGHTGIRVELVSEDTHPSLKPLGPGHLTWLPGSALTAADGNPITVPVGGVTESGALDVDF
jgi:hypothetical protein